MPRQCQRRREAPIGSDEWCGEDDPPPGCRSRLIRPYRGRVLQGLERRGRRHADRRSFEMCSLSTHL